MRQRYSLILLGVMCASAGTVPAAAGNAEPIDPAALEASGAIIGEIILAKQDVFDLNDPRENKWLFRLANRWHIVTRDHVIADQLLLDPGDVYSRRKIDESARILRDNIYLYDASIEPVNFASGKVDLQVTTKDVWTLNPGFSFSRKGGENKTVVNVEELNLLGTGQMLRFARSDDVDRVSKSVQFQDKQLGDSWVSLSALVADNSDGESSYLSVIRPFYEMDARWSTGMVATATDARGLLYDLGEEAAEYQQKQTYFSAWGGWSAGLRNGWARRYSAGFVIDRDRFSDVADASLPAAIPDDRKLVYPFVAIEILQDQFEMTTNRNQIDRTEDYLTGTRFAASLGWADKAVGADRSAVIYSASASRFFGDLNSDALFATAQLDGRLEHGASTNSRLTLLTRFSHRLSEKSAFFATASSTYGHNLDLEAPVEVGGDTGLRGYPLRYQAGSSSFQMSLEQRYFWDWYPLRLFRVGAAVFADAGRTWGQHPLGGTELGWLRDVGLGLRLAPTRTGSGKIIHIDIAFPLDGDPSIDDVQIVLETKESF